MADAAVDDLLRYERGWANAMGDYWRERMERLRTIDTGRLYASIKAHLEQGSVTTIEHNFLQYGIYVAAGVGPAHEWYKWTEAQGGEKVHRINNGDLNFLGCTITFCRCHSVRDAKSARIRSQFGLAIWKRIC